MTFVVDQIRKEQLRRTSLENIRDGFLRKTSNEMETQIRFHRMHLK